MASIREATFDVMRECGLTRIFANPGSTEVSFLTGMPDDFDFVLGLHEGSVVGMATGYAIATDAPAFVNLHTTAGFGNAVGALATARVNKVPLVVIVGQQDRRHLSLEPFLAGKLDGLAGNYPVWFEQPVLPQDVPAAVRRANYEAILHRGPAIVVVPMNDWDHLTEESLGLSAPSEVQRAATDPEKSVEQIASLLDLAEAPIMVVGAGADKPATWDALRTLSERLGAPVWQESFGARAGFPQDHPNFAGHLPKTRSRLRAVLDGYDVALVVGAAAFRQFIFEPGRLAPEGLTIIVVSEDPDEVHRSNARLAIIADPGPVCAQLAVRVSQHERFQRSSETKQSPISPPIEGETLRARDVYAALATRLPRDVVLIEETPSTRQELMRLVPARMARGFISAAMGALGFALPAATGLRMGDPTRPVVAVIGDGSFLFSIQGLWSAAHYDCGVIFIVMNNGRYSIMDRLAERHEGKAPWPPFENIDFCGLATSFGCDARRIIDYNELLDSLDELMVGISDRTKPIVLDVTVAPETEFEP